MISTLATLLPLACLISPPQDTLVIDLLQPEFGFYSDGYIGFGIDLGERLLFGGAEWPQGKDLWISDGSAAGTHRVLDIYPGIGSDPREFTHFGDVVLFSARDATERALWRTDGTAAGTYKLGAPGAIGNPPAIAVLDDFAIVYTELDGHPKLWRTDGTPAGTVPFFDTYWLGYSAYSDPVLATYAGEVYFRTAHQQLWKTDGTAAGTLMLKQFDPDGRPDLFLARSDGLYFSARMDATGRELWKTDGTVAGTQLVRDLAPGPASSNIQRIVRLDDDTLLITDSPDFFSGQPARLWRSDGTEAGTQPVVEEYVVEIHAVGDAALYFAESPGRVMRTDGTTAGTVQIGLADYGGPYNLRDPARVGGGEHLLFLGDSYGAGGGAELWLTGGGTTGLLLDTNPGAASAYPASYIRAGGRVFFSADDGVTGAELHALDLPTIPGAWVAEPFGKGCGLGATSPALAFQGEALLGGSGAFTLEHATPSAPAVLAFSPERTVLALGSGCVDYLAAPIQVASLATDPAGAATLPVSLPTAVALVGQTSYFQAAVLVPGGPFLQIGELSSALEVILGAP